MKLFGHFREHNRQLFRYWDGQKKRSIDPLLSWRSMWEDPECCHDGSLIEYDPTAQDRVLNMTRRMFGVAPWVENGGGLTINETLELLWSFMRYMDAIKKKQDPLPMQSAPTDSTLSPEESSHTNSESDSSSTSPGPTREDPQVSSKRSVQL